jgi:hypothetical protein
MYPLPSKMHVLAVVLTAFVAVAARTCAAADASVIAANKPPLLVENLPASAEAKDFIRTLCNESCTIRRPDAAKTCYELLLPYARSINSSHNRASLAITTVMVSKLADLARDLRGDGEAQGCVRVLDEVVARAREALPAIGRLTAFADDKLDTKNPDLALGWTWLSFITNNFFKCSSGAMDRVRSSFTVAEQSEYAAASIFFMPRPNWTLQSPDGSNP